MREIERVQVVNHVDLVSVPCECIGKAIGVYGVASKVVRGVKSCDHAESHCLLHSSRHSQDSSVQFALGPED